MFSAPLAAPSRPAAVFASPQRQSRRWFEGLPLLLIALLYLGASTGPALFDQNEAQYASAAREMLDRPQDHPPASRGMLASSHWYIPTNDGIPRLQKPPLVYWLLMASMRVFGVNEFSARLPNAVFTLLWLWATFLLGSRIAGRATGVAGATILATMAGTFILSHLIAPEPFLAAFLTLTFWCFASACQRPGQAGRWMFLAWIFMGLGTCSKGLHGALYPLAVAGLLAWHEPSTRPVWKKLLQPAGVAVFLAILVPWYAAVAAKYPGFLHDQFINEQLGHVLNRRFPPDSHRVPWIIFGLEQLVFFLPWTFFVPAAWATRRQPTDGRQMRIGHHLLLGWFMVTGISLLFSSLQDYYLLTAWVPVALWLARAWQSGSTERLLPGWTRLLPCVCLAATGVIVLLAAVYLGMQKVTPGAFNSAAATPQRDTMQATLAGFSALAWRQLLPLVWAVGATFLAGGAGTIYLTATRRWHAVLPATAMMMAGVLLSAFWGLKTLEDFFSLKRVALTADQLAGPNGQVVCAGRPPDNPSLLFYLHRGVYWVHANPADEFASRELGIGRDLFLTEEELARRWRSRQTILLVTEADEVPQWQRQLALTPAQMRPLAQSGTRLLLANHVPQPVEWP